MTTPDSDAAGVDSEWRPLTVEERDLVWAIVTGAGHHDHDALRVELSGARIAPGPTWVRAVKTSGSRPVFACPDGPFPARAYVLSAADHHGEIIVWTTDGHLSGLEYAWVTDEPPVRWPRPDEVEVHPT